LNHIIFSNYKITKVKSTFFKRQNICIFLIFLALSSFSQTIITGKISDAETGEALPFITIVLKGTNHGTSTDFEGFYKINTMAQVDSIVAKSVGYKRVAKAIKIGVDQEINFVLESNMNSLKEVVIRPGLNKALRIVRNAQDNRKKYNIEKLDQYEYESFTKVQIAVDNITEKFKKKKLYKTMEALFDTISTLRADSAAIPVLPVFVSETLSDFYFNKNPYRTKEIIKAARYRGVGIEEDSKVSQVLGSSFQNYNFYENSLYIFDKDFISPISGLSISYYNYALVDSMDISNKKTYKIRVWPKNKGDLVFTGYIWIQDTTFALKQVSLEIYKNSNINFIEKVRIQQEMVEVEKDDWLPLKTRVLIDLAEISSNTLGMIGTYYTSTKYQNVSTKHNLKFFEQKLEVKSDAETKGNRFWDTMRHEKLSSADVRIFNLVDSFRNQPLVQTYVDVVQVLTEGYKPVLKEKFEVGPYVSLVGWNPLEGLRLNFGIRTTQKLFKNSMYEASIGYGFSDGKIKYVGNSTWVLDRKIWTRAGLGIKNDIDLLGVTDNPFLTSSLFKSVSTFGSTRLNYTFVYKAWFEREVIKGITIHAAFKHDDYRFVDYSSYKFFYYKNLETGDLSQKFNTTSINVSARISLKQLFVYGHVERYNFGNLKQPVFTLNYVKGLKGVLGGQFDFDKVGIKIWQYNNFLNFGNFEYTIQAGKTFGTLPYPILEVARGNESVVSSPNAYNQMSFFEFVSDQYISVQYEHNDNGLLFNRVPFVKKLKWRFFYNFKSIYGSLSSKNLALTPTSPSLATQIGQYKSSFVPYTEVGYGIENILKFVRIDFIHRLNYLQNPSAKPFGVKVNFLFKF